MTNNQLTLTGIIKEILPPYQKSEKFTLYSLTITTEGDFSKDVNFQMTEKAYKYLNDKEVGSRVTVAFEPQSKSHNGTWITNLRGYAVSVPKYNQN